MNNQTELEKEWEELETQGQLMYEDLTEEEEDAIYDEFVESLKEDSKENAYVEGVCVGAPLGLPEYNEETEQWEVPFEESPTDYHPYFSEERDILFVSCETAEEACDTYNHYTQNPVMLDDDIPEE